MPGQVTHFYLASRVAESYSTANDPTLNAIHLGFKQVLAANKTLRDELNAAIAKEEDSMSEAAVAKYRRTLTGSNDIAIFSAFCAGAVGPDLWTIPNSTNDALIGDITGSWYFDMGHYNLSHLFPQYTLDQIRAKAKTLSNLQSHFQKAYIFGYISHISLDILAHLKVNVFAGAYHCQVKKAWESEQGNIKEKINLWNNHNKVEHYLDAFVRFFCFEGYHPDSINYVDVRTNHFGQKDCWYFPNYRSYWKKKLDDADCDLSGDDMHILDLSTSLAGAFAHRYKNGEGSELVQPFVRQYFWEAYQNADSWLRSTDAGTLHPDNFKDKDRPQEWIKLKYFSIVDDIWWNDLNDEADTQYYYLHTVIPDLEKVNNNSRKFFSPEGFGHFVQGAISVARSFINDAVSYLGTGDKTHMKRLKFWNLDTGHALRIKRNVADNATGKTLPACIDVLTVLDDTSLSGWTLPKLKEWSTLPANRQDDWGKIPKLPADTSKDDKLNIVIKSGVVNNIVLIQPVDLAIRVRNTCFYEGDKESEISAWILGNDNAYDENSFLQGNEREGQKLFDVDNNSCLEDFSSKYSGIEKRKAVGREARLYTSCFAGINSKAKESVAPDKTVVELKKRLLPRFVKISTARKWVFYPSDTGNFKPDESLHTYKTLYPSEDMALAIYALIKSNGQYIDSMHNKTFTEDDLVKMKRVKIVGVNVVLMIFEAQEKGNYRLQNAWIDGEEVEIEGKDPPPSNNNNGGGGTTVPDPVVEDDLVGPIKALMKGMYFDTSKSFLLPSALPAVRKLNDIYDGYTKVHLLIVGHADTAGKQEYNRILSVERAESLKAYLTDDWKAWYKYYTDEVDSDKRWGDHEDRLMIRSMSNYKTRTSSEDEVVWYQRTRSLEVDGDAGPQTREALIKEYMSIDNTTLPKNADVLVHGCGESHPVKKSGDGRSESVNRRVEIFFFPDAVTPAPKSNCPSSGCSEYQKWLDAAKKDVVVDGDGSSGDTKPSTPSTPSGSGATNTTPDSSSSSSGSGTFVKPKRNVHTVFLHCSASDRPEHDSWKVIDSWHKANGWDGIGYHFFVRKDGVIETGRNIEKTPAAQSEYNPGTIAICAHGLKKENFTEAQLNAVKSLCTEINNAYSWTLRFRGHKEVANKACPVFDYKALLNLDNGGYMQK